MHPVMEVLVGIQQIRSTRQVEAEILGPVLPLTHVFLALREPFQGAGAVVQVEIACSRFR